MRRAALLLLVACGATGPTPATPSKPAETTASKEHVAVFVEYIAIRRAWVEKLVPVPDSEKDERAYRKAKAPEVLKKLAEDLTARIKHGGPARAAVAEAVEASLGERGESDVDRPGSIVIERDRIATGHLPAAAKTALATFAKGAHPGDVMPAPILDADVAVVARALASPEAP